MVGPPAAAAAPAPAPTAAAEDATSQGVMKKEVEAGQGPSGVELRRLLSAAGYEKATTASRETTLSDAANYLELLKARQKQLEIEHRHLLALVGPALMSMQPPQSMAQHNQHRLLQRSRAKNAALATERKKLTKSHHDPYVTLAEAPLSYEAVFEHMAAACVVLDGDRVVKGNVEYAKTDPDLRPRGGTKLPATRLALACGPLRLDVPLVITRKRDAGVAFDLVQDLCEDAPAPAPPLKARKTTKRAVPRAPAQASQSPSQGVTTTRAGRAVKKRAVA